MRFSPLGDRAVLIALGTAIDESTHRLVRAVTAALDANPPAGLTDQVPAFASVTVHYDPVLVEGDSSGERGVSPYTRFVRVLEQRLRDVRANALPEPRVVEIPVCYDHDFGPDLDDVAERHGLESDDVVRIHSEGNYLVYMIGFMPGFAYMGGLSDAISTPRRDSPRTRVPAGSVGIGGQQTGVYPIDSPGGWNLIGRTPVRVFDLERDSPTLLTAGDRVRFRPISRAEYDDWPAHQ